MVNAIHSTSYIVYWTHHTQCVSTHGGVHSNIVYSVVCKLAFEFDLKK